MQVDGQMDGMVSIYALWGCEQAQKDTQKHKDIYIYIYRRTKQRHKRKENKLQRKQKGNEGNKELRSQDLPPKGLHITG
jgi:hypothetical protein